MILAVLTAIVVIVGLLNAPALYSLLTCIVHPYFSPLRNLKAPSTPSWFYGNLKQLNGAGSDQAALLQSWVEEYGPIFKYTGFFGSDRLYAMDTRAAAHVLSHVNDYQKSDQVRYTLGQILGHGLLFVEGDQHRQQRRIMSPAFGPAQIRALTSIFVDKSNQLRDCWLALLPSDASSAQKSESGEPRATIEVLSWLNKMTLDVIGLAGFNYSFDALNPKQKENELNTAMRTMFASITGGSTILSTMQAVLPMFRIIPSVRKRRSEAAQKTMHSIGTRLLASRKAAVRAALAEAEGRGKEDEDTVQHEVGRADIKGKDLLSLLVKANMASDVKEDARMSDADVLAQVPTFLIAGHETTSTAVTWALHALTLHPAVQDELRASLPPPPTEGATMEFLNELPYLDKVVREVMRLYAPVQNTQRIATRADVIPTATEWVDKNGVKRSGIPVSAGDAVVVPILGLNRSVELWGPDARAFKPERWDDIPEAVHAIPGIWGNSLAFSGGTRACIGYRFSVIEMKALLYTLVRAFKFSKVVPTESIRTRSRLVTRPYLDGKLEDGPQMPLYVSAVQEDD